MSPITNPTRPHQALVDPPLLQLQDVAFRYPGSRDWVLKSVSLRVGPGERVGLVGDNGTGKSTIPRLVLGMYRPQRGHVQLMGHEPTGTDHFPDLGFIGDPSYFPGGMALPPEIHADRLMAAQEAIFTASGSDAGKNAAQLKKALGLEDSWVCKPIGGLSRGMRARVLCYLALARRPRLLIADEATEGLDRASRERVLSEVRRVATETEMAILWITHRFEEVAALGTRVAELRDGELRDWGEVVFDVALTADNDPPVTLPLSATALLNELSGRLSDFQSGRLGLVVTRTRPMNEKSQS